MVLFFYALFVITVLLDFIFILRTYKQENPPYKQYVEKALWGATVMQAAVQAITFSILHYIDAHAYQDKFDGCKIGNAYLPFVLGISTASVLLIIIGLVFVAKGRQIGVFFAGLFLLLGYIAFSLFAWLYVASPCIH